MYRTFSIPLPSEDSLSIADKVHRDLPVRIAVIRLPHISNFTDFELLEQYASVEYVPCGASLAGYDCIIIPGTKNTIDDLAMLKEPVWIANCWLHRKTVFRLSASAGGTRCWGESLWMRALSPRLGLPGLGLLDCTTRFAAYSKNTTQVRRRAEPVPPILSSMGEVTGYEIHMGLTEPGTDREAFSGDGRVNTDGLVFGTYMHGLFLNPSAANALLTYLFAKKGLPFTPIPAERADPYDTLASLFEEHVDMEAIIALIKE